ncbi:hypothetical protein Glove_40g49 [Diversispora epigaea]|uniref:Cas12f1-like TNB domain-containing protein n=1 Tax=Diversispora epigaea TaxID=1348612 RepID=A0A397JGN5_9GLOM|nr:hypothetical protein Glove_40g49 [Diversispora epigaea]
MVILLIPTTAETQSRRDWYENDHTERSIYFKTCSACGNIQNIGGRKVYKCKGCNVVMDRDSKSSMVINDVSAQLRITGY